MTLLPDFSDIDLAECAFALELEAMVAGHNRSKLEQVAARIDLRAMPPRRCSATGSAGRR
jgi:hypothetical protein